MKKEIITLINKLKYCSNKIIFKFMARCKVIHCNCNDTLQDNLRYKGHIKGHIKTNIYFHLKFRANTSFKFYCCSSVFCYIVVYYK